MAEYEKGLAEALMNTDFGVRSHTIIPHDGKPCNSKRMKKAGTFKNGYGVLFSVYE